MLTTIARSVGFSKKKRESILLTQKKGTDPALKFALKIFLKRFLKKSAKGKKKKKA